MSVAQPSAVLFDLDGVLIDRDAFTCLIQRALLRRPWRLLPAAILVAIRRLLPRYGPARLELNMALVWLALRGFDEAAYAVLAESTGIRLGVGSAPVPDLIEQLRRHRADGSRVIVATATECRLARSYLDRVGLAEVEVLGTTLAFPSRGGPRIAVYNVGEQKVAGLRTLGVDLPPALLYTDSAADLPLIRQVGRCVLVDPDRATRRVVDRAGLAIPVTTWDVNALA